MVFKSLETETNLIDGKQQNVCPLNPVHERKLQTKFVRRHEDTSFIYSPESWLFSSLGWRRGRKVCACATVQRGAYPVQRTPHEALARNGQDNRPVDRCAGSHLLQPGRRFHERRLVFIARTPCQQHQQHEQHPHAARNALVAKKK
jgi:hypothetical protein